jgi:hypothetical protein
MAGWALMSSLVGLRPWSVRKDASHCLSSCLRDWSIVEGENSLPLEVDKRTRGKGDGGSRGGCECFGWVTRIVLIVLGA